MNNISNPKGSIIIFAISVLALLTSIAIGIVPLFISRYRASLESANSTTAIYTADSGIEWCLYVNREGPNPPPKPTMNTGANLEVYNASNDIATCTIAESTLSHRAVGTFRGVSRSFSIFYPGVPPVVTISCSPCSIPFGGSSTITWSSTGASSCTVSPDGWTPDTSGSRPTGSLTLTTVYTATCTGSTGIISSASTTVSVLPPAWWNLSWLNRKRITLNNIASATDLIDFPILVSLSPSNFDYSKAKAGGADIRFIDEDDLTQLNYEIETWNPGGVSTVWVKVPRINAGSTIDFIYVYYNNPSAINSQNPNGVWNINFAGVWHISSGAPLNVNDSTGKNNGGNNAVSAVSGRVDGGGRFNGSASHITTGTNGMATGGTPWTIEAWLNTNVVNNQYHVAVGYGTGGTAGASPMIGINNTNRWQVQTWGCLSNCINNGPIASTGTWTHVVGIGNGNNLTLYLNGIQSTSAVVSSNSPTNTRATIGGSAQAPAGFLWNGYIDEVRISNTARSSDWIRATYLTENLQMNTFGLEQNKP